MDGVSLIAGCLQRVNLVDSSTPRLCPVNPEERTFSERISFAPGMKTDPECVMLNISHDPLGTATR